MSALSRRCFLGLSAAALGSLCWPYCARAGAGPEIPSLKALAQSKGLHYGSDSDVAIVHAPPQYAALFLAQCELMAPILSWRYVTAATSEHIVWEDPNVAFAEEHNLPLTGAHFLWYEALPQWFLAIDDRASARKAALDHIHLMATRYAGRVFSWNVVNEALHPSDGRADGLRRGAMLDRLGPDFFDAAFHTAYEADPHALLTYNDYGFAMDRRDDQAKRTALLRLLEKLKRQQTPISAVGLQSHLRLDGSRFDAKLYRSFLKDVAAFGYRILITELDVLDTNAPSGIAARDAAVADMYARFLAAALDEPMVTSVVTWGLSDRYTWLTPSSSKRFRRADGLPARPLPFDETLAPKPAFWAIANAFKNAPTR